MNPISKSAVILSVLGSLATPSALYAYAAPAPTFGVPYTIDNDATTHPVVAGDEIRIPVRYQGGCARHVFAPVYRQGSTGRWMWLVHRTDDTCRTERREWITVAIPIWARESHFIDLYAPGSGTIEIRIP